MENCAEYLTSSQRGGKVWCKLFQNGFFSSAITFNSEIVESCIFCDIHAGTYLLLPRWLLQAPEWKVPSSLRDRISPRVNGQPEYLRRMQRLVLPVQLQDCLRASIHRVQLHRVRLRPEMRQIRGGALTKSQRQHLLPDDSRQCQLLPEIQQSEPQV